MSNSHVYAGTDLEAMSFAENYHRWILDEFRPFLGKRLLEVGAGTGLFTQLLLNENPESLVALEPSEMFEQLKKRVSAASTATAVELHRDTFAEARNRLERPDSIIYVNVLEHIEDDVGEIRLIFETLSVGGRCFIFVPALMSLYGEFDRRIGHFRRYDKREIDQKCTDAGFHLLRSQYFDLSGIVPWYVKYRLLRSDSLEPGSVALYDRVAVPVIKFIEKLVQPPIGKNLLVIAEK